jgi:hypothetical protein
MSDVVVSVSFCWTTARRPRPVFSDYQKLLGRERNMYQVQSHFAGGDNLGSEFPPRCIKKLSV